MATIKINELGAGTPVSTDLVPFADPTTGLAEKATITQIATLIQPLLTGKADLNGDSTETFEVADATSSTEAVNKGQLDVAINALQGALIPQGNWDASTNTPDITGITATGYYWIVSVDGSTSLDGITDWKVNDWAVKTATGWAKIDNSLPTTLAYTNVDNNFTESQTISGLSGQGGGIGVKLTNTTPTTGKTYEVLSYDNGEFAVRDTAAGTGQILRYNETTGWNFQTAGIDGSEDALFGGDVTAPNFNGKFDNITLQGLSLSQSLLESWARTRETAGDTYFPNEGAYSLALDKSLGIKPVIDLIPSAINTNVIRVYNKDTSKDLTSSRTSTATYVDQFGEIETAATGVPRIDYTNGVGELLLEPQRRNLLPYSQDFTQTDWTSLSTATLSASTTLAPDGSLSAVKVTATAVGQQLQDVITITSGQTYTVSFWVRRVTGNGVISIVAIENVATPISVTSEWQRFSVTATSTSTNGRAYVRINTSGDEVEVWGAQLEDDGVLGGGDYMTSYIPTNGSAVTRIADAVTGNSSLGNVINSSEGVLYFEGSFLTDEYSSFSGVYLRDSASLNDSVQIRTDIGNPNALQFFILDGGVEQVGITYTASDITQNLKIAFKYELNNVKVYFNGSEIVSDTNATMPSGMNQLTFSNNGFRVRELKVYDTALTDAELTTLTTI
jgi:hypothetical protein